MEKKSFWSDLWLLLIYPNALNISNNRNCSWRARLYLSYHLIFKYPALNRRTLATVYPGQPEEQPSNLPWTRYIFCLFYNPQIGVFNHLAHREGRCTPLPPFLFAFYSKLSCKSIRFGCPYEKKSRNIVLPSTLLLEHFEIWAENRPWPGWRVKIQIRNPA